MCEKVMKIWDTGLRPVRNFLNFQSFPMFFIMYPGEQKQMTFTQLFQSDFDTLCDQGVKEFTHKICGNKPALTLRVVLTIDFNVLIPGNVCLRWGDKYHGRNYMFFDGMTACIGSLSLGKFLPQHFYKPNDENTCIGRHCFEPSFFITTCIGLSACILSIWLFKKLMESQRKASVLPVSPFR